MATPTHESYAAAKPSILAWLFHSADLGVAYGASHLTCAADLLPPKDALLPMGDVCDYSLFCTVQRRWDAWAVNLSRELGHGVDHRCVCDRFSER